MRHRRLKGQLHNDTSAREMSGINLHSTYKAVYYQICATASSASSEHFWESICMHALQKLIIFKYIFPVRYKVRIT